MGYEHSPLGVGLSPLHIWLVFPKCGVARPLLVDPPWKQGPVVEHEAIVEGCQRLHLRQKTFVGRKVNWVIILTRGRAVVRVLPPDWQLSGEGMAEVVDQLDSWLKELLGADARQPRVLFTDRRTGRYSPGGRILSWPAWMA